MQAALTARKPITMATVTELLGTGAVVTVVTIIGNGLIEKLKTKSAEKTATVAAGSEEKKAEIDAQKEYTNKILEVGSSLADRLWNRIEDIEGKLENEIESRRELERKHDKEVRELKQAHDRVEKKNSDLIRQNTALMEANESLQAGYAAANEQINILKNTNKELRYTAHSILQFLVSSAEVLNGNRSPEFKKRLEEFDADLKKHGPVD